MDGMDRSAMRLQSIGFFQRGQVEGRLESMEIMAKGHFGEMGLQWMNLLCQHRYYFSLMLEAAFDDQELFLCDEQSVFLKGG